MNHEQPSGDRTMNNLVIDTPKAGRRMIGRPMIGKQTQMIILLSAVAFLGSFIGSLNARSGDATDGTASDGGDCKRRPPFGGCLTLDPERRERIEALDPTFMEDLASMREGRTDYRHALAELLQAPESTDDEIRATVEDSIGLQNRIERRVLEHLLLIRSELTVDEQQRLFSSISDRIRGHGGRFGRHRGGDGEKWRGEGERPSWRRRSRMNDEQRDDELRNDGQQDDERHGADDVGDETDA